MSAGVNLATAYVQLVASAKGIQSSIAEELGGPVSKAADKSGKDAGGRFGSGFTGGLKSAGKTAAGFLTKAVAGVGLAAGATVGGLLVKGLADSFAQSDATTKFQQSLNFAGIAKAQVDQATKITQKYADDTVYDLSTVQNTAAQLAANGVKNFTGLTEAAGNLNAVAGGNADTFRSVAMVLTQTVGAGKLTTENWNQIANAIPGASGVLQAALKKNNAYTGDFRDAMAKGQITAEEFNTALEQVGTKPIAVKAATSTATFEGAMGNLVATITGGFANMLNKVKPQLTGFITLISNEFGKGFDAASKLVDYLPKIGQAVKAGFTGDTLAGASTAQRIFEGIGNAAYLVQSGVQTAAGAIKAGFSGNANYLKGSNPIIQFLYSIGDVASKIDFKGIFSSVLGSVKQFVPQVMAIMGNTSPLDLFIRAFKSITPLLPPLGKAFAGLAQSVGGLLAKVLPDVVQLTQQFADTAVKALEKALPVVVKGITDFTKGLSAAVKWIGQNKTLVEALAVGIGTFVVAFKAVNKGIQIWKSLQKVTQAFTKAQAALNAVMALNPIVLVVLAVAALAAGLVYAYKNSETFRNFVNKAFADVKAIALDVSHWFTDVFVPIFTQTIPHAFETFAGYFTTAWDKVKQATSTFVSFFTTTIPGAFQTAWDGIMKGVDAFTGFFTKTIPDAFRSVLNWVEKNWPLLAQIVIGIFLFPAGTIAAAIWHFKDAILGFFAGLWKDLSSNVSKGVGAIVGFFTGLPGKVVGGLSSLKSGVVGKFDEVVSWLKGVPGKLASVGSGMWGWILDEFKGAWLDVSSWFGTMLDWVGGFGDDIKGVVTGMWDALTGAAKTAFNWVARAWNDTVGKLSFTVPSWVPEIGGKGWSVPDIPYLAKGTDFFQGGLAVVGERGPEIVDLPRGSRVIPAGPTQDILNGRGQGATFNVNNYGEPWNSQRVLSDLSLAYKAGQLAFA